MPGAETSRPRAWSPSRLRLKELGAFGAVGAGCFVLDVALFQVLYTTGGLGALTAKFIATVTSMTVAFFAHRFWSFSHRARTGFRREYLLFALVNATTLALNLGAVALVRYPLGQEGALPLQLANITGIALGTVIRYLSYRRWVFPAHSPAAGPTALAAGTPPPVGAPALPTAGSRG